MLIAAYPPARGETGVDGGTVPAAERDESELRALSASIPECGERECGERGVWGVRGVLCGARGNVCSYGWRKCLGDGTAMGIGIAFAEGPEGQVGLASASEADRVLPSS
jgi:hypothetical protein